MSPLAESFSCQEYEELESVDQAFDLVKDKPLPDYCFQLKLDGIWGKVIINDQATGRYANVYSKTGQKKHSFASPEWLLRQGETVLLAEYMYGSQWSQKDGRAGLLYVFDCLVVDGQDISTLPYSVRKKHADALVVELGHPFTKVDNYNMSKLGEVWMVLERTMKYEGIIVRSLQSTYFTKLHKLKTEIEDDFVVMDFQEGEGKHAGRLGALILGKYIDGILTEVMSCGGGFSDAQRDEVWLNTAKYHHAVCRVKGKSRFDSGALRHPQFVQFRDDKHAEDCT